ncbi:hypothetical protein BJ684DRAFT_21336 [Piptocephalis cylindrospora]|uniref:Amino acid/polyamine transporter I n=1 Tax=Piptocephalis cylindrospora TaxID=1907219 RepID=A0A4P9Y223_9FUNG|nr:hypothetical protein BJ684DRAFT_21336 [Piptocephalis cylindrospora]|eukprot:RKP12101.1 hypothetical protein BJ684DRAFT_21336 [Piptocephalis cylindrospora]
MINLAFVTIVSCLWTLVGDFAKLVNIYAFILWTFYFATVLGLIVLRWKAPTRDRPFRVWLPCAFLFVLVSGYVVVAPLAAAGNLVVQYVLCILGCLCAVPIWYFRVKRPSQMQEWKKSDETTVTNEKV